MQEKTTTTTTKLQEIYFYFCRAFALFHKGIAITVTFKMSHALFIRKNNQNVIQESNSVIQVTLIDRI